MSVVISSATRVPGFSFDLSTCRLHPTTYRGPFVAFTMTASRRKENHKTILIRNSYENICILVNKYIEVVGILPLTMQYIEISDSEPEQCSRKY